jgi:hypothetical protein
VRVTDQRQWKLSQIANAGLGEPYPTNRYFFPFIPTPMHPEYPCAHCINSAAGAAALEAFFGATVPTFSLTSSTAPGVVRSFSRLSDYVKESVDARVYDGVHYRTSGEFGAAMGRKIGEYAVQNLLKPIR